MTRLTRLVALLVAILAVGSCTPSTTTTADTTTSLLPPPRTVLRVGVESWPECLNPLLCVDSTLQQQILQHVLPGVYRLDDQNRYQPTAVLAEPAIVDVPEQAADDTAMTITYRINPDARWAGGMPITSSDFVGTWRAVMTTPGADTRGYEAISSIDDRDPLVAVVALGERVGDWRELFGGARNHLLQADAFGATTDLTGAFVEELPFAAGPYQVVSWSENEAVLARVDNDWDPDRQARIDQIRYRPITVAEVSPDAFDVLVPGATTRVGAPEGYVEMTAPSTRVVGLWFDQRDPILQLDVNRRILAFALDREALIERALTAGTVAGPVDCLGWVPAVGPWCEAATIPEFPHNPDLSRLSLVDQGWEPDEAGRLVRGEEVFSVMLNADPNDSVASAVADVVARGLSAIGVEVRREARPTAAWATTRSTDDNTGIGVFSLDLGVGPSTENLYDCPAGPASSVIAWCPPASAELVDELHRTVGVDSRTRIAAELGHLAQGATAWVPLVQLTNRIFIRTDRVDAPLPGHVVGGPLAGLSSFAVTG